MGWLDHDRLGFNYRMSDIQAALVWPRSRRPTSCWASASASRPYTRRLGALTAARGGGGASRGLVLPCADHGREALMVRLHGARPGRARSRGRGRESRRARRPVQGVPALHPPDAPLPRTLRLCGGSVPGRRGRLGAATGAAVLPRDHRPEIDRVCEALAEALGQLDMSARRHPDQDRPGAAVPRRSCATPAARWTARWSATACAAFCSWRCSPTSADHDRPRARRCAPRYCTTPGFTTRSPRRRLHGRGWHLAERLFLDAGATPERPSSSARPARSTTRCAISPRRAPRSSSCASPTGSSSATALLSAGLERAQVREVFGRVSRRAPTG